MEREDPGLANPTVRSSPSLTSFLEKSPLPTFGSQKASLTTGVFKWEGRARELSQDLKGPYRPGSPLYNLLIGNKVKDEVDTLRRVVRRVERQLRAQIRKIVFMIMMGDVDGAVLMLLREGERQNEKFNRLLVKQMERIQKAVTKILLALGRKHPPRGYDPNMSTSASKAQRDQTEYSQYVSLTSQLLGEVRQSRQELQGLITEGRRKLKDLRDIYKLLVRQEVKAKSRLYGSFSA